LPIAGRDSATKMHKKYFTNLYQICWVFLPLSMLKNFHKMSVLCNGFHGANDGYHINPAAVLQ
jgi:hypothetical protein